MTDRKRDPLPEGYQFGDARPVMWWLGDRMWQETNDHRANYEMIKAHPEAIQVTNTKPWNALPTSCPLRGVCDGRVVRWTGNIPSCAKCGANWISGHGGTATVRIPKVWNVMESLNFTTYRDPGDETTT